MATIGSFNTTGYQDRYLTFSWNVQSQSISDNHTTISWSLVGAGGSTGKWYNTGNFRVVIDGSVVYQSDNTVSLYNGTVVASGTKTIYHNSDGNRSFTASASAGIYAYTSSNASGSGSWSLRQIPRQATIISAPNFNDEENPTITYRNPAGDAVTAIEACIKINNQLVTPYKEISRNGTSYTYSLSEADRNSLRSFAKKNSVTVTFVVRTIIADNTYFSTLNRTLTIINANPTLSPTVYDSNSKTVGITQNDSNFIKYKSNATCNCNVTAMKGATIVSCRITNNGSVINGVSGTFNGVQSGKFVFSATDSRGNTTTQTVERTCYDYIRPTISITSAKLDASGGLTFSISGNIYSGTFGASKNNLYAYYKYKPQGESFTEWQRIHSYIQPGNYNTYTATYTIPNLDYSKAYVLLCEVEDSFESRYTEEKVVVSKPIFDWGKNDFEFHVPTISGQIYSLGGVLEKNTIHSGDNLNNFVTPGVYAAKSADEISGIVNMPTDVPGRLIVSAALGAQDFVGAWSYLNQEFIPVNTTHPIYRRSGETNGTPGIWTFSEWEADLSTINSDYIIDEKDSGIWHYRLWNRGTAECYTTSETGVTGSTPSAIMGGYLTIATVYLPTTFIKRKASAVINCKTGTGVGFGYAVVLNGNQLKIYCVGNSNTSDIRYQAYISGRWK